MSSASETVSLSVISSSSFLSSSCALDMIAAAHSYSFSTDVGRVNALANDATIGW